MEMKETLIAIEVLIGVKIDGAPLVVTMARFHLQSIGKLLSMTHRQCQVGKGSWAAKLYKGIIVI